MWNTFSMDGDVHDPNKWTVTREGGCIFIADEHGTAIDVIQDTGLWDDDAAILWAISWLVRSYGKDSSLGVGLMWTDPKDPNILCLNRKAMEAAAEDMGTEAYAADLANYLAAEIRQWRKQAA